MGRRSLAALLVACICIFGIAPPRASAASSSESVDDRKSAKAIQRAVSVDHTITFRAVFPGKSTWLESTQRQVMLRTQYLRAWEDVSQLLGLPGLAAGTEITKIGAFGWGLSIATRVTLKSRTNAAMLYIVLTQNPGLVFGSFVDVLGEVKFTDFGTEGDLHEDAIGTR